MNLSSVKASKSIQQIFTLSKELLGNDSKNVLGLDVNRAPYMSTDATEKTRFGQYLWIPGEGHASCCVTEDLKDREAGWTRAGLIQLGYGACLLYHDPTIIWRVWVLVENEGDSYFRVNIQGPEGQKPG